MKRAIALMMGILFLIALAACGGDSKSDEIPSAIQGQETENPAEQAKEINYPQRDITIICPWAVGGNADVTARLAAELLGKELGCSVVVENITGSGGQVGTIQYLDTYDADGYTLIATNDVLRYLAPRVMEVSYDYTQILPLMSTMNSYYGAVVNADSGITNLTDLKVYADNIGTLTCAVTSNVGGITYELMNALFNLMDIQAELIVFGSGAEVATEVLGGHVDIGIAINPLCDQYVQEGSLNYICSFIENGYDIEGVGHIASAAEQGVEIVNSNTNMLAINANAPAEIIERLKTAMEAIAPELEQKLLEINYIPNITTGDELTALLDAMDLSYQKMLGLA